MKRATKLITTLATASLFFTACGGTEDQAADTQATASPEASHAQDASQGDSGPTDSQQAYLDELEGLNTTLTNDELLEAGTSACLRIYEDQESNDEPDVVTGENIRWATLAYMANYENDPDAGNEVTRAAVYHVCPELVDQFDYEAMRSQPFFDDFTEEREALHEDTENN